MQTHFHEGLKWLTTAFATVSTWASFSGEHLVAAVTCALAIGSTASSWYIAQRAGLAKAKREQANLDAINTREQRWLDAIAEWQIGELRAGRIQLPRNRATDIPAAPDHLPELPPPPA